MHIRHLFYEQWYGTCHGHIRKTQAVWGIQTCQSFEVLSAPTTELPCLERETQSLVLRARFLHIISWSEHRTPNDGVPSGCANDFTTGPLKHNHRVIRLNKIAIEATHRMAAKKEGLGLSSVHMNTRQYKKECGTGVYLGGIPLSRAPQIFRRNTRFAGTVIRPDYQFLPRFGDFFLG